MPQTVFNYAKKQLFDMQFEQFSYVVDGQRYTWSANQLAVWLCLLLLPISEWLAFVVFVLFLRKV